MLHYRIFIVLFLSFILLQIPAMAQVPLFVPQEGLQGWWPLDGDGKDKSIHKNDGVATIGSGTTDRLERNNYACYFETTDAKIEIPDNIHIRPEKSLTISLWVNIMNPSLTLIRKGKTFGIDLGNSSNAGAGTNILFFMNDTRSGLFTSQTALPLKTWVHLVCLYDGVHTQAYLNGVPLEGTGSFSGTIQNDSSPLTIGSWDGEIFYGKIDNVGLWERALSEAEILKLYKEECSDFLKDPISNVVKIGGNAFFTVPTNDSSISFIWQTNPYGLGWMDLKDVAQFKGTRSSQMQITKVGLNNYHQSFRVIANNKYCNDVSNTVYLSIQDTCLGKTIIDTNYVTVYDTLLIKTTITSSENALSPLTIKLYPNPSSSVLNISSNRTDLKGYFITISNLEGKTLFSSPLEASDYSVNLSQLEGVGTYIFEVREPTGRSVETKKIILE